MRFGPRFNEILKRNFWIVTAIWLIPFTVVPFMTTIVGVYDGVSFEELLEEFEFEMISMFAKEWTLFYIFTLIYMLVTWCINNLYEKKIHYGKEDEVYYRDLIKQITPAMLSYIDDYGIEIKKEIIATILMLKLKNKIELDNNGIRLSDDSNYSGLLKSEAHVLECIEKGYSPLKEKLHFKGLLMNDLLTTGLIEDKIEGSPRFLFERISWGTYGILMIILSSLFSTIASSIFSILGVILIVYMFFSYGSAALFSPYKKLTLKGQDIRQKLNGLRLFLKDYSNMKNKELNEFGLWDEFMIYSVILNDNKKVQKEVLKILKMQFK